MLAAAVISRSVPRRFQNFLDHFHAAQQAIASASAAAADAAKKNVVNAYEKATRLSLKVKIKAPLIIVPIDSQSMKALCLDLGLIRVSNQFSDHFVHERNAVIDEMKLELSDFKLFHAEMGAADEGSCCGSDTADGACSFVDHHHHHQQLTHALALPFQTSTLDRLPTTFWCPPPSHCTFCATSRAAGLGIVPTWRSPARSMPST